MYPTVYEYKQLHKSGLKDYWTDTNNWVDITHVYGGYINVICQLYVGTWELPSKILMLIVICTSLIKVFFFMKIFKEFSYIVKMIFETVRYLKVFMFFFFVLILMFS